MPRFLGIVLGLSMLAACGKDTLPAAETTEMNPTTSAVSAQNEWKYRCEATLLNGFQWNYQGEATRAEAERGSYFCYGYSHLSPYCSLVRWHGITGPVFSCNLLTVGTVAYTWNRF